MTSPILTNASETELITAVHANLHALFRAMGALPGSEVVETARYGRHHSFPTNPMFRGVWGTRLAPTAVDDAIDEALAWFRQRDAPDFYWWTDPQTEPADLAAHLLRRGFDGNAVGEPGMVADLSALNEARPAPDDFTLVTAENEKTLVHWRDVFAAAYGAPVTAGQAWMDATIAAGLEKAPWQLHVGYWQGTPVATSMSFNGAGVVGIYSVGTVPAARRRGIGTAVTRQPLLAARAQGYAYGVLFASRMGNAVYRRLGFREVASRIGIYIWEND